MTLVDFARQWHAAVARGAFIFLKSDVDNSRSPHSRQPSPPTTTTKGTTMAKAETITRDDPRFVEAFKVYDGGVQVGDLTLEQLLQLVDQILDEETLDPIAIANLVDARDHLEAGNLDQACAHLSLVDIDVDLEAVNDGTADL